MIKDFLNKISSDEGNAMRYRILYASCFLIHTFYAILFWKIGVSEMMYFNIVSSVMYLIGVIAIRNNGFTLMWILLVYAEIVAHGFLCSIYIGFEFMITLFSLVIIPVAYFLTYLDPVIKHPVLISSFLAVINIGLIILSVYISYGREAVYSDFDSSFVTSFTILNVSIASVIIITFSAMFIGKINYDVKALMRQNDTLDHLAYYDQLTGLRNRNHIRDIFDQYIKGTDPYCVILGDIDDFKHVNDTYGHSAGDQVLKTVSALIRDSVGDDGVVCRWGGEEILILVKGTTDKCIALNERMLRDIRGTVIESGGHRIKVTMTFGLCDYGDAMNIEKLISLADKRLYIGKNSGKNQVVTAS